MKPIGLVLILILAGCGSKATQVQHSSKPLVITALRNLSAAGTVHVTINTLLYQKAAITGARWLRIGKELTVGDSSFGSTPSSRLLVNPQFAGRGLDRAVIEIGSLKATRSGHGPWTCTETTKTEEFLATEPWGFAPVAKYPHFSVARKTRVHGRDAWRVTAYRRVRVQTSVAQATGAPEFSRTRVRSTFLISRAHNMLLATHSDISYSPLGAKARLDEVEGFSHYGESLTIRLP